MAIREWFHTEMGASTLGVFTGVAGTDFISEMVSSLAKIENKWAKLGVEAAVKIPISYAVFQYSKWAKLEAEPKFFTDGMAAGALAGLISDLVETAIPGSTQQFKKWGREMGERLRKWLESRRSRYASSPHTIPPRKISSSPIARGEGSSGKQSSGQQSPQHQYQISRSRPSREGVL